MTFQQQIQQGIPTDLPQQKPYETHINHAPKRKDILSEAVSYTHLDVYKRQQ